MPVIAVTAAWFVLSPPAAVLAVEPHGHAHDHIHGGHERIEELKTRIEIHREGMISVEQAFRICVGGGTIKRGPVLNYLTVFDGPGGLTLDNGMVIEKVLKEGLPEPFHIEKQEGFITLYVGSPEVELDDGDYNYTIFYRFEADWHQKGGEFSAVVDAAGSLPGLPIDRAEVRIQFPDGVIVSKFTPALSGFEEGGDPTDPGFVSGTEGNLVTVRTTRVLGGQRSFFLNLAWPSATFATQGQWMKVMTQYPRIPLSAFSAVLLLWALIAILLRLGRKRA